MNRFSAKIQAAREKALQQMTAMAKDVDQVAETNTLRVLDAFRRHRVSDYHFRATSGYAYNDAGRETLEETWATLCGAEAALVRTQFVSGTHALATALFGVLRPGDELVSLTGAPYDTMQSVIGHEREVPGSLKEFGVSYREMPMPTGGIDLEHLSDYVDAKTKMVLIQRSRGYSLRATLTVAEIAAACAAVKAIAPECICFVDNCYGEFVEVQEPTAVGADIMAGSLIKNPGGGLAPTGGYIAGRRDLVELAAFRLTAPGIGAELGASLGGNRLLYQGLFVAPHTTAQAVKGAIFAAALFENLGYKTLPHWSVQRGDIIQAITLGTPERVVAFCQGIQKYSPVDAHVRPEPSGMPGYEDAVIMAAGTFVQGASIELSADAPMREPYAVYLQGGLTFEHAVLACMGAAQELEDKGLSFS